jgi:hypothetical protein
MKFPPTPAIAALASVLLISGTRCLNGQVIQSSILGTVTDSSSAMVPGAKVVIRNEGTNLERSAVTNENGDFRVSGLETGNYEVIVTASGFKTFQQPHISLAMSQTHRIDAKLEVGNVASSVVVKGAASHVETETTTLSNLKTGRDYTQLPAGRNWSTLAFAVAGLQSSSGVEINGARDTANNFTADGVTVTDPIGSRQTANGFEGEIESLQEVKVMTASNSAEYPQVAQFAAVTKSGQNTPHGSFFWGNQNSNFSSRSWADTKPPAFANTNSFAVTNGGPVYLPKIYDGHNRTWYFFSYGGFRSRTANRKLLSVPTPAFRQGDFSSLLGKITIIDPTSGLPFDGNLIPADKISPVSRALEDMLYPDPNQIGQGAYGLTANYLVDPGYPVNSDVYSIRVDQKISDKNTLFVRVGLTITNQDIYAGGLKNGYGSGAWRGNHPGRNVAISDTHIISPNMVNEAELGFNRDFGYWNDFNYGDDVISKIGLQGINNPNHDPVLAGMPSLVFQGANAFEGTDTWTTANYQGSNSFQWTDNLSWFHGRHNFKTGFDIRRFQVNDQSRPQSVRGAFVFDDRLSGFSYANFLLGYPSSATRSIARPNAYTRSSLFGFYAQDEFKLHQRVTLTYGFRYEYQTPWVEKYNRMFTFDPSLGSLVTAGKTVPTDLVPQVAATLPIVSAAQAGLPNRSLFETDGNNFSPRLGLAVRPFGDASTVIRVGWGLYTQMWPGLLSLNATGGPWQSDEEFFLEANNPTVQFPNPFLSTSQFSGLQSVGGLDPHFPNERSQQWNVSIGRELWGTAIDIGYVGTKAQNIPYVEDLNLLRPSTIPYSSARRPYSDFNQVNLTQSGSSSIYHGLTIQADRKMAAGLSFNVNYTWAKVLTDADLRTYKLAPQQNQYQRYLERADDPNIRRQQLQFTYIYELPFGRGKQFLNSLPKPAEYVLGGWQISGLTTMLTGKRLSPSFSGTDPADTNQFGGRPDRIANGNFDPASMRDRIENHKSIFDINAFAKPQTGRGFYGNSARNILTGPGAATWNILLAKNFAIAERARLQFRWETYNAFNRPNFSNPGMNITSGNFGLVTSAAAGRSMLFGMRLDY